MTNILSVVVRCHYEPEGWWAESPQAPGYSAAGSTLEELQERVESGLRFYFDDEQAHFVFTYIFDESVPLARVSTAGHETLTPASPGRITLTEAQGQIMTKPTSGTAVKVKVGGP